MPRLSHTAAKPVRRARRTRATGSVRSALRARAGEKGRPAETVGAAILRCARALRAARVHFGHGTSCARDEAAELVFFVAGLDHARGAGAYSWQLRAGQTARIDQLLRRRIAARMPLPYLTHRAFFAGLELYVDERVLVPRSPIAELVTIASSHGPCRAACAAYWTSAPDPARSHWPAPRLFPGRKSMRPTSPPRPCRSVGATCAGLPGGRVTPLRSDYFSGVAGRRYDIIVSNPPYVGRAEMRALPPEYRHEPRLGLASGADGLDSVRAIFADARSHLEDDGILVVEVGNTEAALLKAFPRLPFVWPRIAMGGGGVFLLNARDLNAAGELQRSRR